MAALIRVLQCGEPLAQRAALATMASAASAVELKFKPHAAAVMPLLQHYMTVRTGASPVSLRPQLSQVEVLERCRFFTPALSWPELSGAVACLTHDSLACTCHSLALSWSPRLPAPSSPPVM